MEVRCANCNDLIDTVDDDHQLGLFQHKVWIDGDVVIIDTVGCETCKYGSGT